MPNSVIRTDPAGNTQILDRNGNPIAIFDGTQRTLEIPEGASLTVGGEAVSAGGASVAGDSGELQFNDDGELGATGGIDYVAADKALSFSGNIPAMTEPITLSGGDDGGGNAALVIIGDPAADTFLVRPSSDNNRAFYIGVGPQVVVDSNGNELLLYSGSANASGEGWGGRLTIQSGNGGDEGRGGTITTQAGAGGGTSGNGGSVDAYGGNASHGSGGNLDFAGGNSGDGNGGAIGFAGGNANGLGNVAGYIQFAGGTGANDAGGGDILFYLGQGNGAGANGKFKISDPAGGGWAGILDFALIGTSDKTFTFPNVSGTVLAGAAPVTESVASDRSIAVTIGGSVYKLLARAV